MIKSDVCLERYTTIGIGAKASYLVQVISIEEMMQALQYAKDRAMRFVVIGRGSNSIFARQTFEGLVIVNKIAYFEHKECSIFVGAGYSFSSLGAKMSQRGFAGLEFAAAIPGTVGGAIFMNAGASGQETKDCVKSVSYINEKLELVSREVTYDDFSYRSSIFCDMKATIVGAEFQLTKDDQAGVRQKDILRGRVLSQPYDQKSAGCMFKNPQEMPAGALIDTCGLKGLREGGAGISLKHANFLVNLEGATPKDAEMLLQKVEKEILRKKGIRLEREVRFII
jgi:UDP-N-acetylmuramate dehydrogenase